MVLTKKEEIIKWLYEFKRIPTSRFIGLLGLKYDSIKKILNDLEKKGKIIKQKETNATYWILKGDEE